jgi:hypothetical protein
MKRCGNARDSTTKTTAGDRCLFFVFIRRRCQRTKNQGPNWRPLRDFSPPLAPLSDVEMTSRRQKTGDRGLDASESTPMRLRSFSSSVLRQGEARRRRRRELKEKNPSFDPLSYLYERARGGERVSAGAFSPCVREKSSKRGLAKRKCLARKEGLLLFRFRKRVRNFQRREKICSSLSLALSTSRALPLSLACSSSSSPVRQQLCSVF